METSLGGKRSSGDQLLEGPRRGRAVAYSRVGVPEGGGQVLCYTLKAGHVCSLLRTGRTEMVTDI